ncbi:Tyrosine recombinase XerD [Klebsiella pneumoniae]|uniref:phage integrase n=1 Tax=Enterobacteriaceae TaxID=543 RepID=UPI000FF14168|nr:MULTISPECIES: tyrosine-type recombinase/integrase [Enterobacteriaceae]MBU9716042.1 tyrosine-type recombinase/integrase [Klebsiella pneumoniae subsp. ozaenae]MBA1457050.1 tyrosine-type recombinase/integrase [Klebsiella pneumoniae]MBS4517183.1 tyrosine-type recombinase/integrase [Klebsiella pneumoniae]NIA50403.1 tyrosine-type recombinase/integrase [Klebsiella pneumoniae]RLO17062.1 site-specific integrase [Klebsiella pneumoniae]
MSIKKLPDGQYKVDIRPYGYAGRRIRKVFERKAEAIAFERHTIVNASQKEWSGRRSDRRHLSVLAEAWWRYYGQTLDNGKKEFNHLNKTINGLGDPVVSRLNKRGLMDYRARRLAAGIKASTINREIYRLSGMFTRLIQIDEFSGSNPVKGMPPLAEENPEMTFLEQGEISRLLKVLEGDCLLIALLCLSTGGRWGEVATLRPSNIVNCRVTFLKTKNGKKRTVPISEELENKVKKEASGKLFKVDYEKFCKILRQVKPDIPANQATHILRHTFASHFMMNGGNIIALQQILGHANIQQTMVYAHLSPEYLADAVRLGPVSGLDL